MSTPSAPGKFSQPAAGWYPNLTGLQLPKALTDAVTQAYTLLYSLRDATNQLQTTVSQTVQYGTEQQRSQSNPQASPDGALFFTTDDASLYQARLAAQQTTRRWTAIESSGGGTVGPQGPQGPAGQAATIAVGATVTGAPGTQASVTNVGSSSAAILDFTIPQGAPGAGGGGPTTVVDVTSQRALTVTYTNPHAGPLYLSVRCTVVNGSDFWIQVNGVVVDAPTNFYTANAPFTARAVVPAGGTYLVSYSTFAAQLLSWVETY